MIRFELEAHQERFGTGTVGIRTATPACGAPSSLQLSFRELMTVRWHGCLSAGGGRPARDVEGARAERRQSSFTHTALSTGWHGIAALPERIGLCQARCLASESAHCAESGSNQGSSAVNRNSPWEAHALARAMPSASTKSNCAVSSTSGSTLGRNSASTSGRSSEGMRRYRTSSLLRGSSAT